MVPCASVGLDPVFLSKLRLSGREDVPAGQTATGRALRSKKPVWDNDLAAHPGTGPLRQLALDRGIRSLISLPLLVEGEAEGVFVLYAEEAGFFTEDEVKVLDEMASNVSFALQSIARQRKIVRLNRVYAVLSGINTLIVHVRERDELFREACRIAVEHGGFGMVWIGLLDAETLAVTPAAWAGFEVDDEWVNLKTTARDIPEGQGSIGRAIRERKPVVINDMAGDTAVGGLRRRKAIERGFRSAIALPLIVEGEIAGTFALFAKETAFFDEEEVKLLTELAGDISFALEHIARQEKLAKLSRIRAVLGEINAAIVRIRSKQELFDEACRIAVNAGHFPFAWIGIVDREAKQLVPVAWAGEEGRYLDTMHRRRSLDGTISVQGGPAVRAVREKKALVVNDIQADPRILRKQEHLEHNVNSLGMLPLLVADEAVGVLALYAGEVGFFDEEEMKLLVRAGRRHRVRAADHREAGDSSTTSPITTR